MGGSSIISDAERKRRELHQKQLELEARRAATELATQIIKHLNGVVIRPGPKPEERECTRVAKELEAEIPAIVDLILDTY